tara:strand:+ start:462 stop:1178 length:717 start_codon:yes stop_codon:yes gene_type:complete
MTLSIIIPVKNEEEIILNTLKQLEDSWLTNIDHEVLIINDNSTDETVNLIKNSKFNKINVVLKNNYKKGLGSAIITGIDNSSKKYVSIYMADMSDCLDDLNLYYKEIISESNIDAVFGSRFIRGSKVSNYPKFKLFLNRFANNIIKIIFFSKYNDFTNAFKIYKKSTLLKLYPLVSENFNIFLELPLKVECRRLKYKIIPISWNGRTFGKSKFKIKEIGSKYIFTMLYCFLEKILLKK